MFWITLIIIVFLLFYFFNRGVENHQPWIQPFDNLKISSEEFYKSCEEAIKKREMPGVAFSRVHYSEGGITAANHEYLHVVRGEHIIDICAAPFGTMSFVSTCYVRKPDFITKVMRQIEKYPFLAKWAETKTYFQMDTDAIFKSVVQTGVEEAIAAMTTSKGFRAVTEH